MKKILSKKTNIAFTLFAAILLFAFNSTHPMQGSNGYTGAPLDNVCTDCHSPGGNLDGTIQITGLPATVDPGQTYTLTVTITDTSPALNAVRAGFQMVSLKQNFANGGIFSVTSGESNTQPKMPGSKSYIGHQGSKSFTADNTVIYNVDWTAPAAATGPITVYGASIIGNNGNGNSNDKFVATNISTSLSGSGMALSATITNVIDATCSNSNDGSATANASGGSGGYTYAWDNGESTAIAMMLSPGVHNVTVSDDSNDSVVESVTIGAPQEVVISLLSKTDAICNGENNGTAEVTATGGTGGYFFDWGNGVSGAVQNDLLAGIYNVTVTDVNGCDDTIEVEINEPSAITINVTSSEEPSCNGDTDGSIEVIATGGNGGFSYTWLTNGEGTPNGNIITDLPAGSFMVEVIDMDGCTNSLTITLGEPTEVSGTVTVTDVNCLDGEDGSAVASGMGGVGNYTYQWSSGGTSANESGLTAGDYSVTITDDNGCSFITSITINQPATAVASTIVVTNQPSCGNDDGTLSAFGSDGTPDYTFEWSDGTVGEILNNVPAGEYSVTVTDANGCSSVSTEILTENEGITLAANNVVNNTCFGDNQGSATISASGGVGTYTFVWSNGGDSQTETNLAADSYTITVTDIGGCTGMITIEITEPDEIIANGSVTSLTCDGSNDGNITISPTGGSGSYNIEWNIGTENENTISNLVPGGYDVTITDSENCVSIAEFEVTEPDPIIVTILEAINPICPGESSGSIALSSAGGTGEISYQWSTGNTTSSIANLGDDDYTVTVTDENDCSDMLSFTLENPSLITAEVEYVSTTCNDSANGSIIIVASGGNSSNYTYTWNNGSDADTITNVPSGDYTVTITDDLGCSMAFDFTLEETPAIQANIISEDVSENGTNDGQATASPTLGIEPYTYEWSNGAMTAAIAGLVPGTYQLTITDANGCMVIDSAIINNGDCAITAATSIENISCIGLDNGSISIELMNAVNPISYSWNNEATTAVIDNLSQGTYSVTATDANGCSIQIVDLVISEPDSITASEVVITNATDPATNDGSISISFTGGTGELTISITDANGNPIEDAELDSLATGTYGILVTDENGCEATFGTYIIDVMTSTLDIKPVVNIYPNPTNYAINYTTNQSLDHAPEIYSIAGTMMETQIEIKNEEYLIYVGNLPNGAYFIRSISQGIQTIHRFIVAK